MTPILLLVFSIAGISSQLTVEDWFFPVSVAPPQDNTIYDEDVKIQPENETINKTNQEVIDYYEKDKLEKWRNDKSAFRPIFKNEYDVRKNVKTENLNADEKLTVQKSTHFLPNSGIPVFIPQPPKLNVNLNEEPEITMSMIPIKSIGLPEEIAKVESVPRRLIDSEFMMPSSTPPSTTSPNFIISTTSHVTTKAPFIYEITKREQNMIESGADMVQLKKDVTRLRHEMNLVKSLLNKLYRKSYKKQKDFVYKSGLKSENKTPEAEVAENKSTRLSALQSHSDNEKWIVINGALRRVNNIE